MTTTPSPSPRTTSLLGVIAGLSKFMNGENPFDFLRSATPAKQKRSRGKGRNRGFLKTRRANKNGKYQPHQGTRECLRRRIGGFAYARSRALTTEETKQVKEFFSKMVPQKYTVRASDLANV